MRPALSALLLTLGLLAAGLLVACDNVEPSSVGTNCVHQGRNPIPVCY